MQGANPCPQSRENFMARTKKADQAKKDKDNRTSLMVIFDYYKDQWDNNGAPDENDPNVKRDGRGRPTVMTWQALLKLRQAFTMGCTDMEAYIYAGVSKTTFYDYCQDNPDFAEEKEELKENPVMFARANVVRDIMNGSTPDSWQYLRAKRKKEFSEMRQHEITTRTLTEADIEAAEAEQFATMEAVTEEEVEA